jgi:hypothetical protein
MTHSENQEEWSKKLGRLILLLPAAAARSARRGICDRNDAVAVNYFYNHLSLIRHQGLEGVFCYV